MCELRGMFCGEGAQALCVMLEAFDGGEDVFVVLLFVMVCE